MELKTLVQKLTSRNWRCHRRRVFFQRIFKGILPKYECHELAGRVPYYPFEEKREIQIGRFSPDLPDNTIVTISRISPKWKIFFGMGKYEVVFNDNTNFQKWVWLW